MEDLAKRLCFVYHKTYTQTFCCIDMTPHAINNNILSKHGSSTDDQHQHSRSHQSENVTLSPTTSIDTIQDWMLFTNHIVPLLDSKNCSELNLTMIIPAPVSIIARMDQDL